MSAQADSDPWMDAWRKLARLARRVDEQDDTARAISDTVLDIKETVGQHTETLVAMQRTQAQHGQLLAEILRRLGGSASD